MEITGEIEMCVYSMKEAFWDKAGLAHNLA